MEEIKVGEYVRTKTGRIAKVTTINNVKYTYAGAKAKRKIELTGTKRILVNGKYELEDIAKYSPNIIDLIECEDYVNGHLVKLIDKERKEIHIEDCDWDIGYDVIKNTEIKSIVTHESFNSIKYEVI